MLIIGKHKINAFSTLPDRTKLKGDDALIYDALFTGGINGTGIAGSKTSKALLSDLALSEDTVVVIRFGDLSKTPKRSASGYTLMDYDPNELDIDVNDRDFKKLNIDLTEIKRWILIELRKNPGLDPGYMYYLPYLRDEHMAQLRMTTNHEISHASNMKKNPRVAVYMNTPAKLQELAYEYMETMAFERGAELAWELDNNKWGLHGQHSGFTEEQLKEHDRASSTSQAGQTNQAGQITYSERLFDLVMYAIQHIRNIVPVQSTQSPGGP